MFKSSEIFRKNLSALYSQLGNVIEAEGMKILNRVQGSQDHGDAPYNTL